MFQAEFDLASCHEQLQREGRREKAAVGTPGVFLYCGTSDFEMECGPGGLWDGCRIIFKSIGTGWR